MTADEFLDVHGDDRGVELRRGEVMEIPMPGSKHGEICSMINMIIRQFVMQHGLGRVLSNDSFIKVDADNVLGPDVSFISYRTLPKSEPTPNGPLTPPLELVVEVRSPSDSRKAILEKARQFLNSGVQVALIVDPKDRSATVLRIGQKQQSYSDKDLLTLPDILPGFSVRVSELFA